MPTPTLAASSRRQIRCTNGSKSMAGLGATVRMFKAVVAKSCKVWPPQHRLIHNGQILKNEKILARIPVIFQDDLAQLTGDVPSFKHADGQAKYSGDVPNMLLHENGYGKVTGQQDEAGTLRLETGHVWSHMRAVLVNVGDEIDAKLPRKERVPFVPKGMTKYCRGTFSSMMGIRGDL